VPAAIRTHALTVNRGGSEVLHGVDVEVAAGSVTGLLGPSGCGKTTLMRCLVGVQANAAGAVEILGMPAGAHELRPRVGYVTQAPAVYADLSVRENLDYFGRILRAADGRVAHVIEQVGLAGRAGQVVATMSGGERSRVSLATALLGDPELLVLDEPTVGLDPVLRSELWALFHELAGRGVTLLISSHVMEEAAECDRLLLMRSGVLLADTTPGELLRDTGQTELGAAFLTLIRRSEAEA